MKPGEITISAYLSVEGEQWLLHLKAEIEAEDYVALARHTSDMVSKLKKAGFKTFGQKQPSTKPAATTNGPRQLHIATFAWPAPMCPACDKDMRVSQYQKNEGLIYYYCSNKMESGKYCKQCATVNNATGCIDYSEVKT